MCCLRKSARCGPRSSSQCGRVKPRQVIGKPGVERRAIFQAAPAPTANRLDGHKLNRWLFSPRGNFLRGVGCTPPKNERCNDAACQKERHSTEREKDSARSLNENIFQQQLSPDQHQKQPKGVSEITKPVDGPGQCEVERTQPSNAIILLVNTKNG